MKALRDRIHQATPFAKVVSRWIDGHSNDSPFYDPEDDRMEHYAIEDLEDVANADVVIHCTETPESSPHYLSGGRHVEFGAAYIMGKLNILLGPKEHVFHSLPGVLCLNNEQQLFDALERWDDRERIRAAHSFVQGEAV